MKLLTPEQVSEQLAVSRSTVLRLIADGALPAICLRSGKRKKVWRVRQEVLEKWVVTKEKASRNEREAVSTALMAKEPMTAILMARNGKALDLQTSATKQNTLRS